MVLKRGESDDPLSTLGDLRFMGGVRKFPQRVKCAMLAWRALEAALRQSGGEANVSTGRTFPRITGALILPFSKTASPDSIYFPREIAAIETLEFSLLSSTENAFTRSTFQQHFRSAFAAGSRDPYSIK